MTSSGKKMSNEITDILTQVATYYSDKLAEHGETARGVDWNGEESQVLRFEQLCRIIEDSSGIFPQRSGLWLWCTLRLLERSITRITSITATMFQAI